MDQVSLKDIYNAISSLREEISGKYVTKDEFAPIKALVYGLVAVIMSFVVGKLLNLI